MSSTGLWLATMFAATAPTITVAMPSTCPARHGKAGSALVNARLFDGPVADGVELVPDDPRGQSRDVSGYRASGRTLHWRCEYGDGSAVTVAIDHAARRCTFKGKAPAVARCSR